MTAAMLSLLAAGCVERNIAQAQVKSALVAAGFSPATSQCVAHRLMARLTDRQLRKLATLQGSQRRVGDYIAALQRLGDPELTRVTLGTSALCITGWER